MIQPHLKQEVHALLDRPPDQRRREYKYRCAQAIVFGLPVLFLEYFGRYLGGPETGRWIFILQALLAGWVMYVGAAGMLIEGVIHPRAGTLLDLGIALVAIGLYVSSMFTQWRLFHAAVILIAGWCGFRWARLATCPNPGAAPKVSSDNIARGE